MIWRLQRAPLMVLLHLATLHSLLHHQARSFSISSTSAKQLNGRNINNNNGPIQSAAGQQLTTLPPHLTTVVQDKYLNSFQQPAQVAKQQQQQDPNNIQLETAKQRSNGDDHDEPVPMATINNHSRNNQALARPPQYVDVSALVGRDRSPSSNSSIGTSSSSSAANSILTPKSRSGLPECATQQVCNAIFVRMNYTQRLCECSQNYNWKCSNNLDPQDGHTIELTRKFDKRIYTQIKTCEPLREVRACKAPTDWTLLALQSERSGKAHYVVVCKCPTWAQLEGPYTHNHPPYANIPGIRVYGMLCAHQTARSSSAQTYSTYNPALSIYPEFPWPEALNVLNSTNLASALDSQH